MADEQLDSDSGQRAARASQAGQAGQASQAGQTDRANQAGQSGYDAQPTPPSQAAQSKPKLFSAVFVAIVGVALFCFMSGQGLNAGISVYIDRLGGSATLAGIGAAVFSGAAIAGRLVSGPLADTRGRLIVMVTGGVILLAGMVGAAVFNDLSLIMVWRALQGLGFSATTTAAATAAADVLPVERLGEGIGYYGLGQALAMSVGPALAIALVSTEPPENLFRGFSVAAILVLVLCGFCRYERHPERLPETATYRTTLAARRKKEGEAAGERAAEAGADSDAAAQGAQAGTSAGDAQSGAASDAAQGAQAGTSADAAQRGSSSNTPPAAKRPGLLSSIFEPKALAGGIPFMVLSPAYGFGIFFVGLLGSSLGVGNAGLFYSLSALSMIAVRLSSKAFMDRVLAIKLFAIAVAAGVVCYGLLLFVSLPVIDGGARDAVFYAAGIFYGLSLGMALPVNQTVAVKNSPAERWGAANGLFLMLMDLGIGTASVVWGITNDHFGFTVTLACVIAFEIASLGVAYLVYPPFAKRSAR